jgi:hypothetical protein
MSYAPLGNDSRALRVSTRTLTGLLMVNALLMALYIGSMTGAVSLGAPMTRSVSSVRMPRMGRVHTRAEAITDYGAFKSSMDAKYPDKWEMKGEGMYNDVIKQFAEKQKYLEAEDVAMSGKLLKAEDLEEQDAVVERGIGAIIAPFALLALPIVTLIGLNSGFIQAAERLAE